MSKPASVDAAQLELYCRYDGDMDGLSRSANRNAKVSEEVWRLIDDLRRRMFIVESGQGSLSFRAALESDLSKHVQSAQILDSLRHLVAADIERASTRTLEPR